MRASFFGQRWGWFGIPSGSRKGVREYGRKVVVTVILASVVSVYGSVLGADVHGPEAAPWMFSPALPSMNIPPMELWGEDLAQAVRGHFKSDIASDSETIERVSGEERGPRIPEPMVFDLMRPLGAKRGEGEVNVLGKIPLRRKSRAVDGAPDPLGFVRRSPDTQGFEWAPEIEYAIHDGLGIEFELPMENERVEALKAGGQATFGTGFHHRFIHGTQVIVQYDLDPRVWTTTFLYLAGLRFNETWSLFGMVGPRTELGGRVPDRRTEFLSNATLFANVTDRLVAGIETNFNQVIGGDASLLFMPQMHYEVGKRWMIQGGTGVRVTTGLALPEVGFRIIREF
uniref:hypothetical protein n=1 Tax=Nitrospira cf. moscoviensis SBR1015 TaxID=96242 RepID=UPI00111FC1AF|nr:hypothetical protein [Nitrospira cf. moscoviensis SBR1015]